LRRGSNRLCNLRRSVMDEEVLRKKKPSPPVQRGGLGEFRRC
jgi:hypothetical protein